MARKPLHLPTVSGRRQDERPAPKVAPPDAERTLPGALSTPIEQLVPDPDQPRRTMDPERLAELAASLTEHGVLQPLLVRDDGYLDDGRTRYAIVAGGRRYAAAQIAGLERLPVIVRDTEGAALRLAQLVENLQRQDLDPLDEARAYKELMDAEGLSSPQLAERLHISVQTVRDRLLVLTDQPIADAVQRGQIGTSAARDILRAAPEPQAELRARVTAGEAVTKTAVKEARERAQEAGTVNPRKTGGGRKKAAPPATDEGEKHTGYAPSVVDAMRVLYDQLRTKDLQAYVDRRTAQDARYDADADPYVEGFSAALEALRRVIGS